MDMKEKNFASVVVYVRNSEDTIQNFLRSIDDLMKSKFEAYEFVLVNDYSDDGTVDKIKSIEKDINGNIILINLAWKHKLELAMLAGVDMAIGDFIYEFESCNMDYKVDIVWEAYAKAMEGYDIVAVSSDKSLKISSKLFYSFINKVSYRNLELTTESFRLVSRRALNRILRSNEKLRYRKALYKYAGFEGTSLKYKAINKNIPYGDNSMYEKFELAGDILIGFSDFGLRISLILSLVFFLISLSMGGYTAYSYLTRNEIASGWTTIMMFLSVSFTGIFFVLGFLSKYMTAILIELQNRPNYTYKSVDRLSRK